MSDIFDFLNEYTMEKMWSLLQESPLDNDLRARVQLKFIKFRSTIMLALDEYECRKED